MINSLQALRLQERQKFFYTQGNGFDSALLTGRLKLGM